MISSSEKQQLEHMMRVVVAMQQLLDTVLAQGQLLLNPPGTTNAPSDGKSAQSAGLDEDPNDPPRLMRPRAKIPTKPEG